MKSDFQVQCSFFPPLFSCWYRWYFRLYHHHYTGPPNQCPGLRASVTDLQTATATTTTPTTAATLRWFKETVP